jgi:hypothetical protein
VLVEVRAFTGKADVPEGKGFGGFQLADNGLNAQILK